MRSILKVLKVAHDKFTWSGGEMPHIGRYGGHKWQTLVFGSWMHEQHFRLVKWSLAIDWEATIKKAVTVIIMLATEQN